MTIKETTLYIHNQPVRLEPSQLIQSGGEGMVFKVGNTAVKRYHQPHPDRAARLQTLLDLSRQGRFPANILSPCALAKNKQGQVVGFQMPLMAEDARPIKQLSRPGYWQKAGINARDVCTLFSQIHEILTRLHQTNTVVGDLNDHNIFFSGSDNQGWWQSFWIDVDSYQFGRFPCPVALQSLLDPTLYSVKDFSQKPVFSAESDWYAYFVMLIKSLLQVHPFGGTHHEKQSLASRATAGITILNSAVTYPKRARPIETLSDQLLDQLERVFEQGQRHPFPLAILENYAATLHTCSDCGLSYPQTRPGCPSCRHQTPVLKPTKITGQLEPVELLKADGYLVYTTVLPSGRIISIVRSNDDYSLLQIEPAGQTNHLPLFTGQVHYRFGFFGRQYLVVNAAGTNQLLILDVSRSQPQQVTMMPTAVFRGQAVFATTPDYLIRVVQGTVMKGAIRDGALIEEVAATARREQTWLWASPLNNAAAGYYRFFDTFTLFMLNETGAYYEIEQPVIQSGESLLEIEALFGQTTTAFLLKINRLGNQVLRTILVDVKGQIIKMTENRATSAVYYESIQGKALSSTTLLHPTDAGILKENGRTKTTLTDTADLVSNGDTLHFHPNGLLVQQASSLYLLKDSRQ